MGVRARSPVSPYRLAGAILILAACSPGASTWAQGPSQGSTPIPVTPGTSGTKSGNTAFGYSLLGTGLPCVASAILLSNDNVRTGPGLLPTAAGYLAGPSLGHFYAGRPKRAWLGIGIRSASALAFGVGLAIEGEKNYDAPTANVLMIAGFWVGLTSAVYDVFDAPKSARLHNEELMQGRLRVTPAAIGVARAPGLRADVTF